MADNDTRQDDNAEHKETVVVRDEDHKSQGTGWIILAVVLIVVLVLIFLAKNAVDQNAGVNVENQAPDTTNIQLPQPNPNPPTPPDASQ